MRNYKPLKHRGGCTNSFVTNVCRKFSRSTVKSESQSESESESDHNDPVENGGRDSAVSDSRCLNGSFTVATACGVCSCEDKDKNTLMKK
jgi:hypothetical protein